MSNVTVNGEDNKTGVVIPYIYEEFHALLDLIFPQIFYVKINY